MEVGRVLIKARKLRLQRQAELGRIVSLTEAAAAMGIEPAALSRIETGKTTGVDFSTLSKLCAYYGAQVCDVLEYTTEDSEDGPGVEDEVATSLLAGPSSLVPALAG